MEIKVLSEESKDSKIKAAKEIGEGGGLSEWR